MSLNHRLQRTALARAAADPERRAMKKLTMRKRIFAVAIVFLIFAPGCSDSSALHADAREKHRVLIAPATSYIWSACLRKV